MKTVVVLICLALLNGCAATPQSSQIQTLIPDSLPLTVELSATPFFPQTEYQCGPAALATVLQFHGVQISPEELARQVYLPGREGSLQIEMTSTTRRHAMLPYPLARRLVDLLTEIAAGNPVLVLQNLSFSWYPKWHYAVVIGYDLDQQEVILRSGTTARWITPFEVFERTWQRADFWALVLVPIGSIPKTAQPLVYLNTAYAFEEIGRPELAFKSYQAATQHWPELAATWMALGNMAFSQQDWPLAISAFSTAARLEPKAPASWNNLAYALQAKGCSAEAKAALQCGLTLSPNDLNLQDSWQELALSPSRSSAVICPAIACN